MTPPWVPPWPCTRTSPAGPDVGHAGATVVEADGFVGAAFNYLTSRAGDPHLHTHVVLAYPVRFAGRCSAADGRPWFPWAKPVGYLYEAHLRAELIRRPIVMGAGAQRHRRHRGGPAALQMATPRNGSGIRHLRIHTASHAVIRAPTATCLVTSVRAPAIRNRQATALPQQQPPASARAIARSPPSQRRNGAVTAGLLRSAISPPIHKPQDAAQVQRRILRTWVT
ncbi:MAG: relaxase domain-containing protein [Acidimicrobiales bacterium]